MLFILVISDFGAPTQYSAEVLTSSALSVVERALWDPRPQNKYQLSVPNNKFPRLPCRSSFKSSKNVKGQIRSV